MRRRVYGESQTPRCPFCQKTAIAKNNQGFAVCIDHKKAVMNDMLCACSSVLEVREGKWGAYFFCEVCGNQNKKRVFSQNLIYDITEE